MMRNIYNFYKGCVVWRMGTLSVCVCVRGGVSNDNSTSKEIVDNMPSSFRQFNNILIDK